MSYDSVREARGQIKPIINIARLLCSAWVV